MKREKAEQSKLQKSKSSRGRGCGCRHGCDQKVTGARGGAVGEQVCVRRKL